MKAHLEKDWPRHGYSLYLFHDGPGYRVPFRMENGVFIYDENGNVPDGAELPRTLFIPMEFYTVIRDAMIGDALDNDDALKDARTVRDRLLAIVEKDHERMENQAQVMFDQLMKRS